MLDFVGIFDKLEKALAFDSDEINAIVKDLGLLKAAVQEQDGGRRRRQYLEARRRKASTTRTWTT